MGGFKPHTPEKRAAVMADLTLGLPHRTIAKKHGIDETTVLRWSKKMQIPAVIQKQAKFQSEFDQKLLFFMGKTLDMLIEMATACTDIDFIKEKPSGARELGEFVFAKAERLTSALSANASGANAELDKTDVP